MAIIALTNVYLLLFNALFCKIVIEVPIWNYINLFDEMKLLVLSDITLEQFQYTDSQNSDERSAVLRVQKEQVATRHNSDILSKIHIKLFCTTFKFKLLLRA